MRGIVLFLLFGLLQSCARPDVVIYVDNFSEPMAWSLDSIVKKKHPNIRIKIHAEKADFLAQSISLGRRADFLITGHLPDFYTEVTWVKQAIPLASDVLILTSNDDSIRNWNDIVTKKKIISVPMVGTPLHSLWQHWLLFEKIEDSLLQKIYYAQPLTAKGHLRFHVADIMVGLKSLNYSSSQKTIDHFALLEPIHFIYPLSTESPFTQSIIDICQSQEFKKALTQQGYITY